MTTFIQTNSGTYINAAEIVSLTRIGDENLPTATLTNGETHEITKADIKLLAGNYAYLPLAEPMPAMMVCLVDTSDGCDNAADWVCQIFPGTVVGWRVSIVVELDFIIEEVEPVFTPGTYLNDTLYAIGVQNRDGTVTEHGGWFSDPHFSDFEAFNRCAVDRLKRRAVKRGANA